MSAQSFVQASCPFVGDGELRAVQRVLATGYFGMGPETRALETELQAYLGGKRGVLCVNTGTSALHLAVAALGIGPGDEVLIPTLTFVASFQAVAVTGARPVACDVSSSSGLLDLGDARSRLTGRTRAIMPVHYAGFPGDLEALYRFAREHGLRVIEDAAHAFGTRTAAGLVGAQGDIVCFSFDPVKNITCGQGGAVVSDDARCLDAVRSMRNLALERTAASGADPEAVEVRGPGWRYAMSDLNAAIGRAQLARFEAELKPRRQALAARYRERLHACPQVRLLDSDAEVVPHIFPLRIAAAHRAAARRALQAAGFETLVHYKPAHLLHEFRGAALPVAERLYEELLTLPLHPAVSLQDADRVAATLEKALAER